MTATSICGESVNDYPQLVRCDSQTGNNWIKVRTIGTKSNRSGIGGATKMHDACARSGEAASAD